MSIPTHPAAGPVDPDGPPPEVRNAFRLYLVNIALGVVGLGLSFLLLPRAARLAERQQRLTGQAAQNIESGTQVGLVVLTVIVLLVLALQLFVVFRMRAGRRWARVVILVLSTLQLLALVLDSGRLGSEFSAGVVGGLSAVLRLAAIVLLLAATSFLFRPAAVRWFRSQ